MDKIAAAILSGTLLSAVAHAQVTQAWDAHFNGPTNHSDAIVGAAIDAEGNTIVTGRSALSTDSASVDVVTIKYDPRGIVLWVRRFDGPAHLEDQALALRVDAAGNAYVGASTTYQPDTGWAQVIIKYAPDGTESWTRTFPSFAPAALALDGLGNVCVSLEQNADFATIKLDPGGGQLWSTPFGGDAFEEDTPKAIAADAQGNVYVTGRAWTQCCTNWDIATVKYNSSGVQQWARSFRDDPTTGLPKTIAVDPAGNVLVMAYRLVNSVTRFLTIKYDGDGNELWTREYSGPRGHGVPTGIVVDNGGNAYITGYEANTASEVGNGVDAVTIKYDQGGNLLWVRRLAATGDNRNYSWAIALDPSGGVVIAGDGGIYAVQDDVITVSYDAEGQQRWVRSYSRPGSAYQWPACVSTAPDGTVIVAGGSRFNTPAGPDYLTIRYCPTRSCTSDFDGDGDAGTDADIESFFSCLAGQCPATCVTADFNGDGDSGTDQDIESFLRVLSGGAC